ncbi:Creatinase/aminopeptidase, partial [Ramicandelaber brevisporus]
MSTSKTVNTSSRVSSLRALMQDPAVNLHIYVVPSEDAHNSEYLANCDARRAFISGFDGSAGCAVVSLTDKAALFTDGRYFLQASEQLDSNWTLMKSGTPGVPTWQEYVTVEAAALAASAGEVRVGIDPAVLSFDAASKLAESLKNATGGKASLVPLSDNLVDKVWAADRPAKPADKAFVLPVKYSGQEFGKKIEALRAVVAEKKAAGFVVTGLDEIAWLFNLRGSDIAYNPVFFAYALITGTEAILYIDDVKLTDDVRAHLKSASVETRPYDQIFEDLRSRAASFATPADQGGAGKLLLGKTASWLVAEAAGGASNITVEVSPVTTAKAIKNETELEGFRQCHLRDGAALVRYFAWVEDQLQHQGASGVLTESGAADKLEELRKEQTDFVGLSFTTISSMGPSGAIIHYSPQRGADRTLDTRGVYLCDSGAQYLDGTTDTTRTFHFGEPTAWERETFTRVLQGHIALDRAVFPEGTSGYPLDVLARGPLWRAGLDFRHGTGHGVGSFLNVHEGPQGVAMRPHLVDVALQAGMTVTNEPGYYEDGKFGIRIENVLLVVPAQTANNFGGKQFLKFENVTMVPIQRKMVVVSMMNAEEIKWLNDYHAEVRTKIAPQVAHDPIATAW